MAISVASWSETASSNSSVGGIDIGEGALASNWNDAIRAVMAGVAEFYNADPNTEEGVIDLSGLSADDSDAAANVTAINDAMADAANDRTKTVVLPRISIPVDSNLVVPSGGNFTIQQLPGGELRPIADMTQGLFQQDDRSTSINNVVMKDIRIRFDTDSGTGNPYIGNGFNLYLNDSLLLNPRVEQYYDDQAFVIALDNSLVINPYFYTTGALAGSGGFRLWKGTDSLIIGAHGQSGDDALMFVPISSQTNYEASILRCNYVGGNVKSLLARCMIASLDNGDGGSLPDTTGNIKDCGFYGIHGESGGTASAGGWALSVEGRGSGRIEGLQVRGCTIDCRDSEGAGRGEPPCRDRERLADRRPEFHHPRAGFEQRGAYLGRRWPRCPEQHVHGCGYRDCRREGGRRDERHGGGEHV